nr:peptidase C39 family protein [Aeromicrobium senzhongii]
MTRTIDLKVPAYSQMIHRGHFPQFGGGGEAWCSPTSTSMVLRYWGLGPSKKATAFAKGADPQVDHAARYSYDSSYRGTGTWPFNTAYASRFGTDAVVHRLVNLRPIESYIKQGVPVIASVAFGRGQLTGAPISSTPGHLLVVRGFTATGDVIVNDPAGRTNSQVRRVYDRAQFERAWLKGSGGVTYVIAPTAERLKF